MNPKLRAFLEKNGLSKGATATEAWALYDQLRADGVELEIDPGTRPQTRSDVDGKAEDTDKETAADTHEEEQRAEHPQASGAAGSSSVAETVRAEVQKMRAAEVTRVREINEIIDVAGGVEDSVRAKLLEDSSITPDMAARQILDSLKERAKPFGVGAHSTQVGTDAREKSRAAITDAVCIRLGIPVEKPAAGASDMRGYTMIEMVRESMEINGENTRGMDRLQLATRAFSGGTSSSDFSLIFSDVVNRRLQASYAEWPQTWLPLVTITPAVDFRDIYPVRFSGAPDLLDLNEHGEYQQAKFSDAGEKYRVITKGRAVNLTRTMLINDDLGVLSRIPGLFGVAARRMEADAVYSLITSNPTMGDGKALFHANHGNLETSGDAINSDSLSLGRTTMRLQKGMAKEMLDIQPAFLLAPVAMETTADILLRSGSLPVADMSSGVTNPWANKLTPICDPHFDNADADTWYLMAHPGQAPVIEVSYLQGNEAPFVDSTTDFDSDGLKIKVRHDFGAGLSDYVGIYKNPGK